MDTSLQQAKEAKKERERLEAEIVEGFKSLFGADPIKAFENAYSKTPESFGMNKEDYYSFVYCFTKSQLDWILSALRLYERHISQEDLL